MKKEKWIEKMEYSSHIFEHLKNMIRNLDGKKRILRTGRSVLLFLSYLKQNNLERIKTT